MVGLYSQRVILLFLYSPKAIRSSSPSKEKSTIFIIPQSAL
ncbi:hypothetical protein OMAG_002232 [Candidatus Omnitrophus magneticus]|uniref:Uncharacterized protein n=1 Tax=Candidatus Omnitrophus magneticus TaxID=1609969 RepID=A0A0F0CR40_9BACT|nr:hypothetical protein OMAG_002232 [Candidatus Omnitrophus magneticus]